MKNLLGTKSARVASFAVAALTTGLLTSPASATQWEAWVGAQSADLGNTALAFLPNEFWIHAGDSIRFTFAANELHTVSFLKTGQIRPPAFSVFGANGGVFVGCPGTTPDGSSFDGSACVSSAPTPVPGQTYTVQFPSPNNFKLVCLVHTRMTGAIHVLPLSETLPYDQAFYDRQASMTRDELLSDGNGLAGRGVADAQQGAANAVTAGISAIRGNGGGSQEVSVMRFLGATMVVRVGDTVEWTNLAPSVFHTVTFGAEPINAMPPSPGLAVDSDGVRHAVVSSPNDSVNSGFVGAPNQETVGQPQAPVDFTRFRVTFTAPGTFNYICSLHDDLGMKGTVIVH